MTRCRSHRIMIGELLIGSALIVGAIIGLFHWEHMPLNVCMLVLLGIMRAAIGGIFMNINLHLANSDAHPWRFPKDDFDEDVNLDSLMPAIQAVFVGISGAYLARLWRAVRGGAVDSACSAITAEPMAWIL